jgi:hypothetical protein
MKLPKYLRRHKKSDDRPYVMGGMAGNLAFLIFGIFCLSVANTYLLRLPSLASVISSVLVDMANGDRGANSLGGLTVSPLLTAAAQAKADDMAAKGYFAHTSPDGKNSWYWFKQEGYTFLYAGENLAVDFSDSSDVERAWMNSPAHRANILGEHFTEVGIASAQGSYEGRRTTFVVEMFGTPAPRNTATNIQAASSPVKATEPALATAEPAAPAAAAAAAAPPRVLGTEAGAIVAPQAPWWQHLLASPKTWLEWAFYAVSGLVLVFLAFVTELEFHRRHLRHVVASVLLILMMIGLFVIASVMLFPPTALANGVSDIRGENV